jgi:protein-L-isoaspartate(D-aspartate) O-methyltransferase
VHVPTQRDAGVTDDRRRRFVDGLRRDGVPLGAALEAAFAAVPREAFVADGFQGRNGVWVRPDDRGFLDTVYRDDVLVTKVSDRVPVSSSSQPSLMALMLTALDVRPGMRVLEIGAGTGYNAALLAALGAEVVSVDVQADVAERARAALHRAGVSGVTVVHGDGYVGAPGQRFNRVIVTVGVAGLSPHWLTQLDGGHAIVPVQHAGTHPILAVRGTPDGPVSAVPVCPAGFMSAAGPLTAHHAGAHPEPASANTLPDFVPVAEPRWARPLDSRGYRDLWYAAGVWHRRATYAALPGFDHGCLALIDADRTGGAAVLPDGAVCAGGPRSAQYAAEADALVERWTAEGAPPLQAGCPVLRSGSRRGGSSGSAYQLPARRSRHGRPSGS